MYKVRMIPLIFFLSKEATVNFLAIIIPKFSLLHYLWIQQGNLSHAQIAYVLVVSLHYLGVSPPLSLGSSPHKY